MFSALLLLQLTTVTAADPQPFDNKAEFLASYEPAAKRVAERLSKNWQFVVHGKTFENGELVANDAYEFLSNDRCILLKEIAAATKLDAAPSVEWNLLRPDGVYVIRENQKPGSYILKKRCIGEYNAPECEVAPFWLMTMPVMRFGRYLPSVVKSPETKVLGFGDIVKNGQRLRELKIETNHNKSSSVSTLHFDATEDWLLQGIVVDGSVRTEVSFRYQTVSNEQVLERVEVNKVGPDGVPQPRFSYDFDSYRRVTPADSEFSLEKFGLPESVNFAPRKSTPLYVWILAAAAGCAAFALLFWFLARRRAGRRSTASING